MPLLRSSAKIRDFDHFLQTVPKDTLKKCTSPKVVNNSDQGENRIILLGFVLFSPELHLLLGKQWHSLHDQNATNSQIQISQTLKTPATLGTTI